MKINVFEDYETLSANVAAMIVNLVKQKPASVLCLATGDTPKLTYRILAERALAGEVDFSNCFFIGLDEWVGISPENTGSCHWFLHHYLFDPMKIKDEHIFLFDPMSDVPEAVCKKMNDVVLQKGGIDIMLVGVGMNGHIGFNEPGTGIDSLAHVTLLDEMTMSVGKKYFNGSMDTNKGITLGLQHFMDSGNVFMMANGTQKAGIIKKILEEEIATEIPATLIRKHNNGLLLTDREAMTQTDIEKYKENLTV